MDNRLNKVLLNPITVVIGVLLGIMTGTFFKQTLNFFKFVSDIYMAILQMCVIPIMSSAILISIGELVRSEKGNKSIIHIIKTFMIIFLSVSIFSIMISVIAKPIIMADSNLKNTIGKVIIDNTNSSVIKEIDSKVYVAQEKNISLAKFVLNIIPKNIFSALDQGENLKIIFFFIVLGVLIKYIPEESSNTILVFFDGIYRAFQKMIKVLMLLLPFGLWALVANQIATTGFSTISSFVELVVLIYIVSIVIFFIFTIIMWKQVGGSYFEQFKYLGEVIILCLGTRNSFAAIPGSIAGVKESLKTQDERIGIVIPLGVTLCRYGNVMTFSIGAIFAMQLYGFAIKPESILIIIVTSILASMATSGTPGIVSRTMIALVLGPLGIPSSAIIVILIALDPILDPIITLINVYPNCVAAASVVNKANA